MTILSLLLILCAIGLACYAVNRIPMDQMIKNIVFVILIIIAIYVLLVAAGVAGSASLRLR